MVFMTCHSCCSCAAPDHQGSSQDRAPFPQNEWGGWPYYNKLQKLSFFPWWNGRNLPRIHNSSIIVLLKPVGCRLVDFPPPYLIYVALLPPPLHCIFASERFIGCHQLAPLPPWALISSFSHCSICLSHPLPGYTHDSTHLCSTTLHILSPQYNCHQTYSWHV